MTPSAETASAMTDPGRDVVHDHVEHDRGRPMTTVETVGVKKRLVTRAKAEGWPCTRPWPASFAPSAESWSGWTRPPSSAPSGIAGGQGRSRSPTGAEHRVPEHREHVALVVGVAEPDALGPDAGVGLGREDHQHVGDEEDDRREHRRPSRGRCADRRSPRSPTPWCPSPSR